MVCVSSEWAGMDNAWEQEKLETGKMLVNRVDSHHASPGVLCRGSGACFVSQRLRA
jgi:hypothetical protein